MDLSDWEDSGLPCDRYNCNNQGISAGCSDIYAASLDCQWIDVTTVQDGNYTIRVTTNPYKRLAELDYSNNTAEVTVELSGDDVRVVDIEDLQSKEPEDGVSDSGGETDAGGNSDETDADGNSGETDAGGDSGETDVSGDTDSEDSGKTDKKDSGN